MNRRKAAGWLGAVCVGLSAYVLAWPARYVWPAAVLLFCLGGTLLAYAVARVRFGPDSKLRRLLVDHPGMRPEERRQTRAEREREMDLDSS